MLADEPRVSDERGVEELTAASSAELESQLFMRPVEVLALPLQPRSRNGNREPRGAEAGYRAAVGWSGDAARALLQPSTGSPIRLRSTILDEFRPPRSGG